MKEDRSGGGESVAEKLQDVSNILLSGPSLNPAETTACTEALDLAQPEQMNALVITYGRDADSWMADFRTRFHADPSKLKIISVRQEARSVSAASADGTLPDNQLTTTIESPRDLTGLGIQISEFLQHVEETKWETGAAETVICFDSLTSFLQFVDPEQAHRFLHVITNRISASGATAHYHVHPDAVDEQTLNSLKHLFDGIVLVDEEGIDEVLVK